MQIRSAEADGNREPFKADDIYNAITCDGIGILTSKLAFNRDLTDTKSVVEVSNQVFRVFNANA